jgi:hypothetical protein
MASSGRPPASAASPSRDLARRFPQQILAAPRHRGGAGGLAMRAGSGLRPFLLQPIRSSRHPVRTGAEHRGQQAGMTGDGATAELKSQAGHS